MSTAVTIDCLQYCNWSRPIFDQMVQGGVDAVHVTICYHEDFRETVSNIETWNRYFQVYSDRIVPGRTAQDIVDANKNGKTAIIFGFQNCSPILDDIGLIEICHQLGVRFMQLSYNNQSVLATGCYEQEDPGITRMGHQVIKEMNRVGLVIDMSHSAEKSTLQAIELSERPIAITLANTSSVASNRPASCLGTESLSRSISSWPGSPSKRTKDASQAVAITRSVRWSSLSAFEKPTRLRRFLRPLSHCAPPRRWLL